MSRSLYARLRRRFGPRISGAERKDRIDEVLSRSDVLVVVVPLTELTRNMIGPEQLDRLPHGAFVVGCENERLVQAEQARRYADGLPAEPPGG